MVFQEHPRRIRRLAAPLLGAAALCAISALASPASANPSCAIEPSVVFAYPSLEAETILPRNAQLLFVTASTINDIFLVWSSDQHRSTAPRVGVPTFERNFIDTEGRLTLGRHEAELIVDAGSSSLLIGPDTFPLRFSVADVLAPAPDASGSAAITRVSTYRRWMGGILVDDPDGSNAVASGPTDCSREVALQSACRVSDDTRRDGDYRVELEAEGSVLGFAINERYFLPAHCRSAFVWDSGPYDIRVVTEAGVGSSSEYAGEVEAVVSSARDPLGYPDPNPICNMTAPGGVPSRGGLLAVALLLGLFTARAARRSELPVVPRRRPPPRKTRCVSWPEP